MMQKTASPVKKAVAAGDYQEAFNVWLRTRYLVANYTNDVDLYNFLVFDKPDRTANKRTVLENGEYRCLGSEMVETD